MAGLPWLRLDSSFYSHDKILNLLDDPSAKKWQAITCYVFGLTWCVQVGNDGRIPKSALGVINCTPTVARLLVKYQLWDEAVSGWQIRNFADRQQLSDESYTIRKAQHTGGIKGNCIRHHGLKCGCWKKAS